MAKIKIDTSDNKLISIELFVENKSVEKQTSDSRILRSQASIPLIDDILKKNNLNLKDLTQVDVVEGPGSFTGVRVGVSIANAFGYLLNISVNGKKIGDLARPVYN